MDSNTNTLPDQRLAQPVVVSSDWFDQFNKLLTKATNASFDCGEFNFTAANGDEYNRLCEKSSNARAELEAFVRSALSNSDSQKNY